MARTFRQSVAFVGEIITVSLKLRPEPALRTPCVNIETLSMVIPDRPVICDRSHTGREATDE
jgi:hypothetical protein